MTGETILHYKIIEKLGEGGMGVVYKAEDTELKRLVALKFLSSSISTSAEDFARLKQEAQSAAILNHPNICIVYAIEEENGRRFISMEYMEGVTLRKKIADAPLSIDEAILYAIQIGEALDEAHKNGIVHRDIKTENIMINSKNQVKVMDFGLAKYKDNAAESRYEGTYGTLAYMSPEQAMENPSGFPADIWSYGVVCYEMFTGRLPFIHSYEAAIIYSILNEEPVPPSQIRPDIPQELENVILRCLQKEEEKRFQNPGQIVQKLIEIKKVIASQNIRESFKRENAKEEKKATEQKQATIVYMKIQDYDELHNRVDHENIVGILEKYYNIINLSAQKFGGTVNKTKTSEAVIYFGLPAAIENASHKALNAAIEISSEFSNLIKQYKIPGKFSLNIAVSSGVVIAGSISSGQNLEYTVIGEAVEIVSKLIESASDGQILVEHLTFRTLKDIYTFKPYKSLSLKGKRDPVKIYELDLSSKEPAKDLTFSKILIHSEIVGRNDELDKLEYLILKAINGEGSVVTIIADAGIGKSRLLNEFKKKEVFQRVILLEGKAEYADKNVSFHPIIDLIKQWACITDKDNESQAFSKLENTIINLFNKDAVEIIPFVATLMGYHLSGEYASRINEVSPDALSKLIQNSIRLLVLKGSELKPVVIIIEDLHWADLSSIELMQSLFRLAEHNKLLFISTLRPNFLETGDKIITVIREKYSGFYTEINLKPLNLEDRRLLIQNLLKMKQLPQQIEKSITKSTEGNPFFIEEVLRSLIDDNIIEIKNNQFIIPQDIGNIVIPGNVKDVLLARIDKLDESTKYILKVASVIGRYFLYGILKKVTEEFVDLETRVQHLIRLELINENNNSEEREYLFQHALAQEAVYETLLTKSKQEMHFKVADAIEKLYADRIDDFYELLAHHYSLADDKEKAEEYLIKAGERTLKNAASNEALIYFKEALKLYLQKYGDDVDTEKIFMLEKNIGLSFYNRGYFVDSVEHFKKSLQSAGIKTDRSNLGEISRLVINLFLIIQKLYLPIIKSKAVPSEKDYELFDMLYKIAVSYANYNGKKMFFELLNLTRMKISFKLNGEEGFATYSYASSLFTYSGLSFSLGKKFLEKANSIAKQSGIDEVYNTGHDATIFICLTGNWKSFSKINEKLLDVKLRAGDLFSAIYQISWAMYIIISRGEYEYAEYLINRGDEISETYDFDYGKLYMLSFKADLELSKRNIHKSISYFNKSCELAEKLGLVSWIVGLSGKRAKAFILLNDLPSAKDSLDKAEKALKEADSLTPMLISYFIAYKLFYYVHLYENGLNDNSFMIEKNTLEKEISKCMKDALKVSKKVAEIKPEVNRFIGNYYWCRKKYRKTFKYFQNSISNARHLEALPELGRCCIEFGRFLYDPTNPVKNKSGEKYFVEAKNIFDKLNLSWDLNELKRIENLPPGKINLEKSPIK